MEDMTMIDFRNQCFDAITDNFTEFVRLFERFAANNADDPDFVSVDTFFRWMLNNLIDVDA